MTPHVSYMTWLDTYVVRQASIIVLVLIENCTMGLVAGPLGQVFGTDALKFSPATDATALTVLLGLWTVAQVVAKAGYERRKRAGRRLMA